MILIFKVKLKFSYYYMVLNLFYTVTVITVMTNYYKKNMQQVNTAIAVLKYYCYSSNKKVHF